MYIASKIKLEKIKKLKLPEKVRATADKIEKGLSSADAATQKKAEDALNKLYDQIKAVAAKQREEKTEKEVNEKTIVPQNADISAPEAKKELTKKTSQFDEAIDKALKNDPELANFGKSDKRRDAGRKALPAGRRVAQKGWANQFGKSDGGRVYYENRENRKDRKSPAYKQGYPFLAKGGKIHPMDDEDGTFYVNFYKTKGGNIVSVDEREYKSKASAMTYAMMKRDFMTVDESIFVMNDDGDVLYTSIGTKKMGMGGKFPYQNAQVGDNARVILDNKMGTIMVTYGRRFHLKFPDGSEKTYSAEELEFFPTDEMMADGGNIERPTFVIKNLDGKVVFKTKSLNKASDNHFLFGRDTHTVETLDGRILSGSGDDMADGGEVKNAEWSVTIESEDGETYDWVGFAKNEDEALYKTEKEAGFESVSSGINMITDEDGNKIEYKYGGMMAKGGQVGDDVLKLKKGDVFKIIDKEHTATNEDFVFIDYVDYRNQIALEVIPLPLIVKQKFTKGDFKYLFDISSDGIKLLDEKELSAEFKKHIYNFLIKIGQKLPYNMNYAKGGYMADGGVIGNGKNGYVAFYKGKKVDVNADTMYGAQKIAAKHFNAKKEYEVNVVLAEIDGKQYYQSTAFAKGGDIGEELLGGQSNAQLKPSGYKLISQKGREIIVSDDGGETKERYVKNNGFSGYRLVYKGNDYEFTDSFEDGGMMADGGYMTYQGTITNDSLESILKSDFPKLNYQIDYNEINGYRIYGQKDVVMRIQKHLSDEYDIKSTYQKVGIGLPYLSVMNQIVDKYAKGGYMADGENYEYVNTFKRFDSNVPVPQEDFEKLVDAYHKQLSGDKLAVSKYKVLKLQMGNYLGHKTVEEMEAYIEKTHNAHKMADGGETDGGGYKLKDIKGRLIEEGDLVKTKQAEGGLMSPSEGNVGIVEKTKDAFNNDALLIRFRKTGKNYDTIILLNGQINEIIEKGKNFKSAKYAKGGVLKNATYVSKRNINDIKVKINKSIKDLKGADLLDGVYVKNNALKAKFDAYKSYEELSELNGKIWDKYNIQSGSEIYASDSLQKKLALEYIVSGLDDKFKKLTAAQRRKVAEIMTDENEHSLRNYLTLKGYLGQKEYDSYSRLYEPKRPYVLNPENFWQGKMADGGSIGFEALSKKVASRYAGKNVKPKYQKEYGKTYDKAEAKEVGDKVAAKVYRMQQGKMAMGGKIELPYQLDKYFTKPAGTIEVEMSKLIPIRARKSGIENAEVYMKKAYDGEMSKRKPIEIYKTRNKKYRVNDGNSTYAVAKKNGWETIYATVVSNPNVTKRAEKSTFTIAKEIRKAGESWSDAVKRVKENRK
jgi:hypothetical protein